MKKTKQIVSLITIFSFLLNTMPVCAEGEQSKYNDTIVKSEENQNTTFITEDELKKVVVSDKEYDGTTTADVDCTQLNEYLIHTYKSDINFTAKGYFDQKDASGDSDHHVVVKEFLLEGKDADKFTFNKNIQIDKRAKITKKKIVLEPSVSQCYYGQSMPSEVSLSNNNTNITDIITIPQKAQIIANNKDQYGYYGVGTYEYKIINVSEQNYSFEVSEGNTFTVVKYNPPCSATGSGDNDFYCENNCTLSAPEGFLISTDKKNFSSEINVKLQETIGNQKKSIEYYIKNNDSESKEYGAVSEMKEYNYLCVYNTPEIKSVEISRKINPHNPLAIIKDMGLISNETIVLKAKAQGNYKGEENYPVINLYSVKKEDILIDTLKGTPVKGTDNLFEYEYEFILPKDKDYEDYEIELTGSNDAGESERVTAVRKDQAENHLIVDENKPKATDNDIVINYVNDKQLNGGFFVADGIVTDSGAGIAKLEYKWDYYGKYIEYKVTDNNDLKDFSDEGHNHKYYEGARCNEIIDRSFIAKEKNLDPTFYNKNNNKKSVHFRILVPYENSYRTPTNKHTLFLKITDYAGNEYTTSGEYIKENQSGAVDNLEPEIKKMNIRSGDGSEKIKILPSGNYSNKNIVISVSGSDRSDSEDYISGLSKFELKNDENNIVKSDVTDENAEYTLILYNNHNYSNSKISAVDKGNYDHTNSISAEIKGLFKAQEERDQDHKLSAEDMPDEYLKDMQSDTFIIENVPPKVEYDLKERSAEYDLEDENVVWFNSKRKDISLTFYDETSGLNSIIIQRGLKSIGKFDFSGDSYRTNTKKYTDDISQLPTGEYTYSVEMSDNAGNLYTNPDLFTINVDNDAPVSTISASSPKEKIQKIGDDYWTDSEDQFEFTINGTDYNNKDVYSGVKKIDVSVNGKEYKFNDGENVYSYQDINPKNQTLKISRSELEKQQIPMNDDHTYNIKCTVTDFAENTSTPEEYTLHVDLADPSINSVEVKNINNPLIGNVNPDKANIVNLLPFGIFSNSTLTFKVKTSDVHFDSGVKEIKVKFTDSDKQEYTVDADSVRFIKEESSNDEYCYEFDVMLTSGVVFDKYLNLTVFDNYGKSSTRFQKVSMSLNDGIHTTPAQHEEDDADYVNVIIEDKAPDMHILLPEPDYTDKEGKQWFNTQRRSTVVSVSDSQSGLKNVSVCVNGRELTKDCQDHKLLSPEDVNSILKNVYEYTFYTDAPDPDNTSLPENGEYTLTFNASDNAGNISDKAVNDENSSELNSYTYYIDDTAPEISSVDFAPASVDGIDKTRTLYEEPEVFMTDDLHYGLFFKSDYDLKVYGDDKAPSSGLRKVNYKLISYEDSSDPKIIAEDSADINDEGYALIHINKGFKGRVIISAEDNVGNRSDEQYADGFVSEDVAPELSMTYSNDSSLRDGQGNELYNQDVSVTVTVTDTKSGIKNCKVDLNSEKTGTSDILNISDLINSDGSLNGWTIEQRDANLITKISKTYTFSNDDNNISLTATAVDNCENQIAEPVESKKFTIDKTDPVIDVSCTEGYNGSLYYNKDKKAVITLDITERNFDENLIKTEIQNTYTNNRPDVVFTSSAPDKHRAVLTFNEGDYVFTVSGSDRAGHKAIVNTPYEGTRRFYVDETAPVVETNFKDFEKGSDPDNFFNSSKKAKITIREHNFDQNLANLVVLSKQPGSSHDENNMNDTVNSFVKYSDWKTSASDPDLHTIEFDINRDSVYQLLISPGDKAGNNAGSGKTSVFEIDTQKPVVTKKNGQTVTGQKNETEFLDIYTDARKNEPSPSIEFDDINFDHLEYSLVKFVPDARSNRELDRISAETMNGNVTDKQFVLDEFSKDGTYALEIKAVDKAGNSSVLNKNTYVKMTDKEVLAYIPDSNIQNKTGLFSLEYENGEAISKRPENFSDMDIVVMAQDKSDIKILLRDMNGDEKDTMLSPESEDDSMYGVGVYTYKLKREFFIDNYQNDTDSELHLTVMNGEERIDLARIHIDNIAPAGEINRKFKSWHWYPGNDPQKIVISDISELLNASACKVFDKGQEIPFEYSEENKTISFTLSKGWHDIGVHLEDNAGNIFDIQQVDNIYVGYFWLWVIIGGTIAAGGTAAFILLRKKFKK